MYKALTFMSIINIKVIDQINNLSAYKDDVFVD